MATLLNAVQEDTVRFLDQYPPFYFLSKDVLGEWVKHLNIVFYKQGDLLFEQESAAKNKVYILKSGAVELEQNGTLIDICDAGDIIGVRSALSGNAYLVSAKATENSLAYIVDADVFKQLLNDFPKVNNFFLKGLASGLPVLSSGQEEIPQDMVKGFGLAKINDVSLVEVQKNLVSCSPETTLHAAAKQMKENRVGSILVLDENGLPKGIITDSDFRKKVVAERLDYDLPVSEVMSYPVKCIAPNPSVTEVLLRFVKGGYHHLCVTQTGEVNSKALGIISNHDILLERGDHPGILLKEIRAAHKVEQLAFIRRRFQVLLSDFISQGVSIGYLTNITTVINDAVIEQSLAIISKKNGWNIDAESFVWLSLGSEGRQEQLLQTDVDNALLFKQNDEDLETQRSRYIQLAEEIIDVLEACGFARCPADMMASNRKWCLSLEEWQQKFKSWIDVPVEEHLLHSNIFFDYRLVYGSKKLITQLTRSVYSFMDNQPLFLHLMAKNALQNPPPLSFFRSFIVEKDGEHKDQFDIKARALMPLIDGARVLTLEHRITGINNTSARYQELADLDPSQKDLYLECATAFKFLLKMRTRNGIEAKDSGRYIDIKVISKIERQMLRAIFKSIERLQSHLKTKFSLERY